MASDDATRTDTDGEALPTEAELREVIDNPAMTIAEKQLLLERYARLLGPRRSEGEAALEPLEAQIAEALALLGAGGHRTG